MEKDPKLEAGNGDEAQDARWEQVSSEDSIEEDEGAGKEFDPTEFRKELKDLRDSVDRLNAGFNSIKRRFLVGIAMGLGTVVGATIVVSLLAILLRPLANIEMLRPSVESLIEMMDEERERKDSEEDSVVAASQKTGDEADLPRSDSDPEDETSELHLE